jgi:MFS family permease
MPAYWPFLASLVPTGLAVIMFTTTANAATQLGTTPAVRGRVMGLYMLVFLGGAPLGSPLVGWVAEQFGARMSLIAGGLIAATAAATVAFALAHMRGVPARAYLHLASASGGRTAG